jgi:hypothetical protein
MNIHKHLKYILQNIYIKLGLRTTAAINNTALTSISKAVYEFNGSKHSTITLARDLQSSVPRPNLPNFSTVLTFVKYVGCLRDPGSSSKPNSPLISCTFCMSIYFKNFLMFLNLFSNRSRPNILIKPSYKNIKLFYLFDSFIPCQLRIRVAICDIGLNWFLDNIQKYSVWYCNINI